MDTLQELNTSITLINSQLSQFPRWIIPLLLPLVVVLCSNSTTLLLLLHPESLFFHPLSTTVVTSGPVVTFFSSVCSRIAYMTNLLRGKVGQWATVLWEGKSWVLDSYDTVRVEFRKVF